MNIQLASDLHLDLLHTRWPQERLISPAPNADVLVLAGDRGRFVFDDRKGGFDSSTGVGVAP